MNQREHVRNPVQVGAAGEDLCHKRERHEHPAWALAWTAAERGAHQRAARLLGSAERVRQSSAIHEGYRQQHERSTELVLGGLAQRLFDAAYERGRALGAEEDPGQIDIERPPPVVLADVD